MSKQVLQRVIDHEAGLHLRPAALFVQTAAAYEATVRVRNVTRDTGFQNAKSAIGVMMLKVAKGDTIEVEAEGDDAESAIQGLIALMESGFAAPES